MKAEAWLLLTAARMASIASLGVIRSIVHAQMPNCDPLLPSRRSEKWPAQSRSNADELLYRVNWSAILDMLGEANNIPDFAKVVLNAQGLQLIQAGTMLGQAGCGMVAKPPPMPACCSMGLDPGGSWGMP